MNYLFILLRYLAGEAVTKVDSAGTGENFVTQTTKISDYVNITPLWCHLNRDSRAVQLHGPAVGQNTSTRWRSASISKTTKKSV